MMANYYNIIIIIASTLVRTLFAGGTYLMQFDISNCTRGDMLTIEINLL